MSIFVRLRFLLWRKATVKVSQDKRILCDLRVVFRSYGTVAHLEKSSQVRRLYNASSVLIFSILDHLCSFMVIIISLVFFYLSIPLFSGFLQYKGNFLGGQNNSKYLDWAPLNFSFVAIADYMTTPELQVSMRFLAFFHMHCPNFVHSSL